MQTAANPVALEIGPGGDLYYVNYEGGAIHRVSYSATNRPPVAVIGATPTSGATPLTVDFDGTGSSDPDPGETLTYAWDLDGDGNYDDAALPEGTWTYQQTGVTTVRLLVTDSHGATATTTQAINAGGALPTPVIDSPAGTLTWSVGDAIAFAGHATDGQGQAIPASGLDWTLILHHCPGSCHAHEVQTFTGVASGMFNAPDHDYPSYLELRLEATAAGGGTATASVSLNPTPATLSIATSPAGLGIVVGSAAPAVAPFTKQVIANTSTTVSAPPTQTLGGVTYAFASWSDGGAATHGITVPAAGRSLTATYTGTGTTAYLSDLAYTVTANGWGPVEKDRSNGELPGGDGRPITLNGTVYPKGLGVHAASDVRYAANGACTAFTVKVGVDDESGSSGSVVFQVYGDADQARRLRGHDRCLRHPDPDRRPHGADHPPPRRHQRRRRRRRRPRRLGRRPGHLRGRRSAARHHPAHRDRVQPGRRRDRRAGLGPAHRHVLRGAQRVDRHDHQRHAHPVGRQRGRGVGRL